MRLRPGRAVLAITLGALALVVAARGGAMAEIEVGPGNLELTMEANFSPRLLDKFRFESGEMRFSSHIETVDGGHPPALRELVWELDRNVRLDGSRLPKCRTYPGIHGIPSPAAKERCEEAMIGRGRLETEILFEESKAIRANSPLIVYNGGVRDGVPTLRAVAYITKPVPSAIVLSVMLKPINDGRYRTAMAISVPKIAGGNGSVTNLSLHLRRRALDRGRPVSFVSLRCVDRRIQAHATETFSDGTTIIGTSLRPCSVR
jgi:hypothetical protein